MEELQQQTNYIEAVLDSVVDAMLTITERGVIEKTNATAVDMFGYTEAEVTGVLVFLRANCPHVRLEAL